MKRVLRVIFLIQSVYFLTSCEGFKCSNGTVMDKSTNLPLDSVFVNVVSGSEFIYTDTTGKFNVCNRFGGCVPDCKDITITFSKNGYDTLSFTNLSAESIVYMEK